ncbi:MAG: hypothetical protein IT424_05070 [Pirellulales bacterium]|nr:hypothetical protein [Pirellulales bacterium]
MARFRFTIAAAFVVMPITMVLAALPSLPAAAQEFRIETDVIVGEEETPASHSITLFEKSAVYEFNENPNEIIVYRKASEGRNAQFILLDVASQRRTDVEVDRVERLIEKLSQWAANHQDPLIRFSAEPTFEESFDQQSGALSLSSPKWTYKVATIEAQDAACLERYQDFIDRYTKLSTMLQNGPPPGPRLALNAALAKHRLAPVEIQRTTGGENKNAVRATHIFSWRLSREDRARLDEAQAFLASFDKVDNEQFMSARAKQAQSIVRGQSTDD